jgi:hypothetical protein
MIREARADEVETLLAIQRRACVVAFAHIYPPERYPFPADEILIAWRKALADSDIEVYIADAGGEPVGSVSIGADYLRTLYVLPPHWRASASVHEVARARSCGRSRRTGTLAAITRNGTGR